MTICPRHMVSIGIRRKSGPAAFHFISIPIKYDKINNIEIIFFS